MAAVNREKLWCGQFLTYSDETLGTNAQHFTFVRTDISSKFTFGYCRHAPKTSTALVFLTLLPWQELFVRVLDKCADIIGSCEAHDLTQFLRILYNTQLPEPGTEISVRLNGKLGSFHCTTPPKYGLPSIPESRNLTEYFSAVEPNCMIAIFAALLNERRIIMKSRKLSKLSACVQAANTLIYPMDWQHIFIPIIPNTTGVIETILAPMPYLIGVPTVTWESVRSPDVGDVVVLDLDAKVNQLECKYNDMESLPVEVTRYLKSQLRDQSAMGNDGLARTFLRALVRLIGGYRDALKLQEGEKITFSDDAFVESRPLSMQPFLRQMLTTQIFQQFKEERLNILNAGLGFSDEFEFEANNYSARSHPPINDQYYQWVGHMKNKGTAMFNTVKSKTNPAMKSAVKKVKDSGKEVKSAYKDMKTRIRKDGHYSDVSNSTFHKTRPLTIGSPVMANATFTKQRGASSVVPSSRSNEYMPLSTPGDEMASPFDEVTEPPSEMNLMADLHHFINQKCTLVDKSPPIDRTLKPVHGLDRIALPEEPLEPLPPARTPRGGHTPLSRPSWSVPLASPTHPTPPTNPFSFQNPSFFDPFGFTNFNGDNSQLTQSLPSVQQPTTFPVVAPTEWFLQPAISQPIFSLESTFAPTNPFSPDGLQSSVPTNMTVSVPKSQCNGDLIRLDSTSPPNENSLSRDSSDDSIKFKTGITNPLYPYTTPSNAASKSSSYSLHQETGCISQPKNVHQPNFGFQQETQPSNLRLASSPFRNNTSFVHRNPRSTYNNENDADLLKEYGIDFSAASSNNNHVVQKPSDPFDLFDTKTNSTPTNWTTFD